MFRQLLNYRFGALLVHDGTIWKNGGRGSTAGALQPHCTKSRPSRTLPFANRTGLGRWVGSIARPRGPIFWTLVLQEMLKRNRAYYFLCVLCFPHLKAEGSKRSSVWFLCVFLAPGYFTSLVRRASTAESDPSAFCCSALPFSINVPSRPKHAPLTPDGIKHWFNLPPFLQKKQYFWVTRQTFGS